MRLPCIKEPSNSIGIARLSAANRDGISNGCMDGATKRRSFPAIQYLLRDRDSIYGEWFRRCVLPMDIEETITSPWENPCAERFHGSIRGAGIDQVKYSCANFVRAV